MKHLIKLSFIGALAISSLAQAADIDTVTVTPQKATMLSQQRYPMRADEFYKFKRAYELSNGMTLSVYSVGDLMYARLNSQPAERIVATSQNTFSSMQTALKMRINANSDGEASGEVTIPVWASMADNSSAQQHYVVASLR